MHDKGLLQTGAMPALVALERFHVSVYLHVLVEVALVGQVFSAHLAFELVARHGRFPALVCTRTLPQMRQKISPMFEGSAAFVAVPVLAIAMHIGMGLEIALADAREGTLLTTVGFGQAVLEQVVIHLWPIRLGEATVLIHGTNEVFLVIRMAQLVYFLHFLVSKASRAF